MPVAKGARECGRMTSIESDIQGVPRSDAVPEVVIRPSRVVAPLRLRELLASRDLLWQLATREIRARYRQSILGKVWVLLQPLLLMLIYYTIFGLVLKLKTGIVPFPLFLIAGLVVWLLFSNCATLVSTSISSNAQLINKIYFPRLLLPFAQVITSLIDFSFTLIVLAVFILALGRIPEPTAPLALVFVVLAVIHGTAFGLWFAPLSARFRDTGQVIPLVLQVAMYATPIFYPPSLVPESWHPWYYLNPLAGAVQGFRWMLLGDVAPYWTAWIGQGLGVLTFVGGLYAFRVQETELADAL